jgi:hypothetical protein
VSGQPVACAETHRATAWASKRLLRPIRTDGSGSLARLLSSGGPTTVGDVLGLEERRGKFEALRVLLAAHGRVLVRGLSYVD